MAKEFAKAFYSSKAWQDCRSSYIAKVYGMCERCGMPGLILHHKIKLNANNISDPEIALSHSNLEFLCLECHNREHSNKSKRRFKFGEDGSILPL